MLAQAAPAAGGACSGSALHCTVPLGATCAGVSILCTRLPGPAAVMAPAQRLPSALHSAPRSTYVPSSTAPGGAALPGSSSHHVRPPSVPPPPAHPPPAPPPPSRIPVPVYLETTGGGQRNPGQQVGNGTEGTGRQEESRPWQQHDSASSPPLHEQGSPVKLLGDGSPQPPSEQQQERTDLQPSGQARQQEQ